MSNMLDKQKFETILKEAYAVSKDSKTINATAVEAIIAKMKEVLKDDED